MQIVLHSSGEDNASVRQVLHTWLRVIGVEESSGFDAIPELGAEAPAMVGSVE